MTCIRFWGVVFFLCFSISGRAQMSVGDKLSDVIQSKDIAFDLDLFSLHVGDVVGFKAESGLRVFPNSDLSTYSRVEPLIFKLDLQYQVPAGVFYVGGRRSSGLSGEFIRQFENQSDAFNLLKYPPYILDNNTATAEKVPFTADRALNLRNKDYFRYQLRTAMTIHGGMGADIGLLNLNVNKSYVLYGDLQIEVYKKGNQKILVRASSLKKKDKNIGISFKKNFVLELFEIGPINSFANSLIPKELVRVDLKSVSQGSLFAVEYEFDLNQVTAQNAYNQIMDYRKWNFLDLEKLLSGSKNTVLNVLNINIQPVEDRAQLGQGDVQRLMKSSTHFSESSGGSSFNFRLVKGQNQNRYIEQDISLAANSFSSERLNYRIATVIDSQEIGGWLLFKSAQKEQKESNALFELDSQFKVKKFLEFNFSYERSDIVFNVSNQRDTAGHIYALVPGDLHGPGVRDFVEKLQDYHKDDVYVKVDFSLEPRALVVVNRLSVGEIQDVILRYVDGVFKDQAIAQKSNRDYGNQGLSTGVNFSGDDQKCQSSKEKVDCFYKNYRSDLKKMLELVPLAVQVSSKKTYEEQWRYQSQLNTIGLYRKIGAGVITRLLMAGVLKNSDNISQFYRFAKFKFEIRGRNYGSYVYEMGRNDQMAYLQEILKIRNRILQREYDPVYFE